MINEPQVINETVFPIMKDERKILNENKDKKDTKKEKLKK